MAKKVTLEDLASELRKLRDDIGNMRSDFRDDIRHVRKDIIAIHSDLIKHDERMDKMLDAIQDRKAKKLGIE